MVDVGFLNSAIGTLAFLTSTVDGIERIVTPYGMVHGRQSEDRPFKGLPVRALVGFLKSTGLLVCVDTVRCSCWPPFPLQAPGQECCSTDAKAGS